MSEEKKKGCFFWGCLTMVIIALIIGILIFLGYRKIKNTANEFTSPTPIEITPVEYTPSEKTAAEEKVKSFVKTIKDGKEMAEGEFTDKELNIFIDAEKDLKGKAQLKFEDNKIKAKLNVPLKNIPIVGGRYLAGDAELKITCTNGNLDIRIESYEVNGKPAPEEFMEGLRKENIAKRLYNDPKIGPKVKRIKTIRMENNKLFIEVDPE